VVPAAQLPQASAQNEVAYGIANIIGPSVGATLYQTLGRAMPFVGNVVTYAVSALALMRIKTPFSASRADSSPLDMRAEVAEGLRWMWGNRLIRFMALLTGCWNMVTAATPLIIIVLAQALGVGDAAIGAIFSGAAIGGIAGSLVGGQIQKRFTFGQVICAVMWIEVISFPLLIVAPSAFLLGAIAGVNYFVGPVYNVVQFSYRLAIIPDRLQGRVNSVFRLLAFGFIPIGAALSGILIERLGAAAAVAAFSAWLLLLAIVTTLNREVRNAPPVEEAMVRGPG
jgi:predicted MFS family arabinose efflux permease